MTVRIYKSTDASAPLLQGQSGALITVLDAVLVNGYGALSAAGWTKPFSGTNKAVYRMVTTGGNSGFFLNVQDNAPGAGGAREARIWGYETASAQDTGTGTFPTVAQMATGLFVRKSATADSTNRAWTIVADGSMFYMFIETGDATAPVLSYPWGFGDIFSFKASDAYKCLIIGRNNENSASVQFDGFGYAMNPNSTTWLTFTRIGHYMARHWNQGGTSVPVGTHWDQQKMGGGATGGATATGTTTVSVGGSPTMGNNQDWSPGLFAYPNPPDGGLYLSPLWVQHGGGLRGYLKGIWVPLHDRPLNHLDTFTGQGAFSGKSFICLNILANSSNASRQGQVVVETSDTWS